MKGGTRIVSRLFLLIATGFSLEACTSSGNITEYQVPAAILRAFRSEHPLVESPVYNVITKDGLKVYQVSYLEGETEKEIFYNVQGKPFVSRADKRRADQERERLEEEAREASEAQKEETEAEHSHSEHPDGSHQKQPLKGDQASEKSQNEVHP